MKNIRDIMRILGCDEATVHQVFDRMGINGLDFSECTNAEFKLAAQAAARELGISLKLT